MSAIAGIKAELIERRAAREDAAAALDVTHQAFIKARVAFERDQMAVEHLNDRSEALAKALRDLGGTDD